MALLTRSQAQQQLSAEVKWWRSNPDAFAWKNRPNCASAVGNNPANADSIDESDYNAMGNQWCGTTHNKHQKRSAAKDDPKGGKIFKEADASLSGGRNSCHFIESRKKGKFNW